MYKLSYTLISEADCPRSPNPAVTVDIAGQATTYTLEGLLAWSVYNITVQSANSIGTTSNTIQVSTAYYYLT